MADIGIDKLLLFSLVQTKMPFGKYQNTLLCDLPEAYLGWFQQKGYPKGKLGIQLQCVYEIKSTGCNAILQNIKRMMGHQAP